MRTGMRWTTFTQVPEAFCGGSTANSAPVAWAMLATGAEFAVLPPQNATGNWVKVVQRIPVRIAVTCPPGAPPLRMGMSTTVEIDTGHTRSIGGLFAGLGKTLGLSSASASSKP